MVVTEFSDKEMKEGQGTPKTLGHYGQGWASAYTWGLSHHQGGGAECQPGSQEAGGAGRAGEPVPQGIPPQPPRWTSAMALKVGSDSGRVNKDSGTSIRPDPRPQSFPRPPFLTFR